MMIYYMTFNDEITSFELFRDKIFPFLGNIYKVLNKKGVPHAPINDAFLRCVDNWHPKIVCSKSM